MKTGDLSVSSNGSTWVKLFVPEGADPVAAVPFSILERIDVGETFRETHAFPTQLFPFSILERIDVGETHYRGSGAPQ